MKHKQSTGFCLWNMNISILNIHINARNRCYYLTISSSILFFGSIFTLGRTYHAPSEADPCVTPIFVF